MDFKQKQFIKAMKKKFSEPPHTENKNTNNNPTLIPYKRPL